MSRQAASDRSLDVHDDLGDGAPPAVVIRPDGYVAWTGALTDPGWAWAGSLDLHGRMSVASIRLEAQAPPPRGPSPILDPRYAVCGTQQP